jgi:hypothetical protein
VRLALHLVGDTILQVGSIRLCRYVCPMSTQPRRRMEVEGKTLLWGDATQWKAELREESVRRHLARPIAERLQAALALVMSNTGRDGQR